VAGAPRVDACYQSDGYDCTDELDGPLWNVAVPIAFALVLFLVLASGAGGTRTHDPGIMSPLL
jgi:hypothetical protein